VVGAIIRQKCGIPNNLDAHTAGRGSALRPEAGKRRGLWRESARIALAEAGPIRAAYEEPRGYFFGAAAGLRTDTVAACLVAPMS
jgi:hypothetical protein